MNGRGATRSRLLLALLVLVSVLLLYSGSQAQVGVIRAPTGTTPIAGESVANASSQAVQAHALSFGYDPALLPQLSNIEPLAPSAPVELGISLELRDTGNLSNIAIGAATPGSPIYGDFLTHAEFIEDYAPTPASYSTVLGTLSSAGFALTQQYSDRSFVEVTGTAAQAEKLFSTKLVSGEYEGRTVTLPSTAPVLPGSISPLISSVSGLSTEVTTFRTDSSPLQSVTDYPVLPNNPHSLYGLDQLYNLTGTSKWPTKETIALLLWGDGYNPSDILTGFASQLYPSDEPQFNVQPEPMDGAPAPSANSVNDPSGTPFELTLDMEWSESQAPGATVMPVYVPDGPESNGYSPSDVDLENALAWIVNSSGANVLSMSFGSPDGSDVPFQDAFDQTLEIAASEGMSVFASSGDSGGSAGTTPKNPTCTTSPQVEYPATSPWVTAVGGTNFVVLSNGSVSEQAWSLSTGGFSQFYKAPSWQLVGTAGSVIETQGNGDRGVPDVSGPAADDGLYYNGSVTYGQGTSFASPLWAGITAELDSIHGKDLGLLAPGAYRVGTMQDHGATPLPYNDITIGANCIYPAAVGWDPVTGYGSPHALAFYGDLVNGLLTLAITFNPNVATPGQSVNLNIGITNETGVAEPGMEVYVTVFTQPPGIGIVKILDSLTATSGSSGSAQVSFSLPADYIYSSILVQASVESSTGVGLASQHINVSALGWWGPLQFLVSTTDIKVAFFIAVFAAATALGWALGRKKLQPSVRRVPAGQARGPPVRPPTAPARPPVTMARGPPVVAPTRAQVTPIPTQAGPTAAPQTSAYQAPSTYQAGVAAAPATSEATQSAGTMPLQPAPTPETVKPIETAEPGPPKTEETYGETAPPMTADQSEVPMIPEQEPPSEIPPTEETGQGPLSTEEGQIPQQQEEPVVTAEPEITEPRPEEPVTPEVPPTPEPESPPTQAEEEVPSEPAPRKKRILLRTKPAVKKTAATSGKGAQRAKSKSAKNKQNDD